VIWITLRADRLRSLRGQGESFSDVILRIAGRGDAGRDERAG
jgi:predicted CopG family antitoxin